MDTKVNKQRQVEIFEEEIITPRDPEVVDLFNGEPFAVWCFSEESKGSYYSNPFYVKNQFRNVICIEQLKGNENIIYSARWIVTDNEEIKKFAEKYNRKVLE